MVRMILETPIGRRSNHWVRHLFLVFLLLVLSLGLYSPAPTPTRANESQTHVYRFDLRTIENETTYHCYGIQQVRMDLIDSESLMGYISWNFTLDEGSNWIFLNITKIYYVNRTYFYAGFPTSTAWWINPTVQIGDPVTIDGDAPATSSCTRSGSFLVTDLVPYMIDNTLYTCWLLTYDLPNTQHESFYYEQSTGTLVAAYSEIIKTGNLFHTVQLELVLAKPSLPVTNPFIQFWLSYGHIFIAFITASLAMTGFYWFLRQIRRRRVNRWLSYFSKA